MACAGRGAMHLPAARAGECLRRAGLRNQRQLFLRDESSLKVLAASEGQVTIKPQATLGCPMTVAFNRWVEEIAQPAAQAWFGEQIVEVRQLSSYSCRRIGGSGNMSEHGFGNALDVAGFTFASGRIVTVKHGWNGSPEERGFLRQIHAGGCEVFTTVLGPGYDAAHHDHFHFDLARRNSVVCRPTPQLISPPRRYPNDPGPVPMVQKQQKHYERFPVARVERPQEQPQQRQQSLYENSDVPPQRFVPRAKQQPLLPDQAYPPAPQQVRQQPNRNRTSSRLQSARSNSLNICRRRALRRRTSRNIPSLTRSNSRRCAGSKVRSRIRTTVPPQSLTIQTALCRPRASAQKRTPTKFSQARSRSGNITRTYRRRRRTRQRRFRARIRRA